MSEKETGKRVPQVPAVQAATYEEVIASHKLYFNIVKRRKWWFIISLAIIIPGIISLMLQGLNLGIDYTGGSMIDMRFDQKVTQAAITDALESVGLEGQVQLSPDGQAALIRTVALEEDKSVELMSALTKVGSYDPKNSKIDKVGPAIGRELTNNALLALSIAAILMLIYISFRFQLHYALAGVAALVHDILVMLGIFSIFQWQIDSAFVAAVLTVFGYSINDTVVIFDRIRENENRMKKQDDYEDMVDKSIWQTMRRSINTVLTVLIALFAIFLLGGESTKVFSLAMIIGVSSGAYSSIFIASQLFIELRKRFGANGGKRSVKAA